MLLIALLQFGMPQTGLWFRYHHTQISEGQIWRLFTGHFVHLGWRHYLMNCVGIILVYSLYSRWLTTHTLVWWCLLTAFAVSIGLIFFSPQIVWYVGFSGVLHGLIVAGAVLDINARHWGGELILTIVALKLVWEQLYGPLPGSESAAGGTVVVDAHLYGSIGGLMAALLQGYAARYKRRVR